MTLKLRQITWSLFIVTTYVNTAYADAPAEAYVGAWKLCDKTLTAKKDELLACIDLSGAQKDENFAKDKQIEQYQKSQKALTRNPFVYLIFGLAAGLIIKK